MRPDQQRTAIAQACGWTEIYWLSARGLISDRGLSGRPPSKICSFKYLPDYLNDLNAMHEAEKVLTSEQVTSYVDFLELMNERWSTPAFATAAQRAEAFLRALGLWQETPTQNQ
jgi:hypothetical protein